jgi:hypothetical protein
MIRVFVASPGDLADERLRFRDAIEGVNRVKASSPGVRDFLPTFSY